MFFCWEIWDVLRTVVLSNIHEKLFLLQRFEYYNNILSSFFWKLKQPLKLSRVDFCRIPIGYYCIALRKKRPHSKFLWSIFIPNMENTDQKNFEYGLFSRSVGFSHTVKWLPIIWKSLQISGSKFTYYFYKLFGTFGRCKYGLKNWESQFLKISWRILI